MATGTVATAAADARRVAGRPDTSFRHKETEKGTLALALPEARLRPSVRLVST